MTLNTYTIQNALMTYAQSQGFIVYDTDFPDVKDEPMTNGVPEPYVVMRTGQSISRPRGGSFGGARYDEMYMLVDFFCVAATPEEARELAYNDDGINDAMTGARVSTDAGELTNRGAGRTFTAGDGTAVRPRRYIAAASFEISVNLTS